LECYPLAVECFNKISDYVQKTINDTIGKFRIFKTPWHNITVYCRNVLSVEFPRKNETSSLK